MPDHRPVTDEDILSGFASLHEAIATGFAAMQAHVDRQLADLRIELRSEFRSEIARLEHRLLRRFDDLEARIVRLEARLG